MKNIVLIIILTIAISFGISCLAGALLMWCWNWILVGTLGVTYVMTFWPAVGIAFFVSLIIKLLMN